MGLAPVLILSIGARCDLRLLLLCPVQAAVIPALLESTANGFLVARGGYRPRDLCVSAPTGSGKTLAFVIPVVQVSIRTPRLREGSAGREPALLTGWLSSPQALLGRAVCQVRALVVLPTKELAQQVRAPSASGPDLGSVSLCCFGPVW